MIWLGVATASAAGAVGRLWVMAGFERRLDRGVPWGTGLINVIAAAALGYLMVSNPSESDARVFGAGFLGSFSTFSTWMVEGVFLAGTGTPRELGRTVLWVVGLLALGVLAYGVGRGLAR